MEMEYSAWMDRMYSNDTGELSLYDNEKLEAWVEHYSWLLNVNLIGLLKR